MTLLLVSMVAASVALAAAALLQVLLKRQRQWLPRALLACGLVAACFACVLLGMGLSVMQGRPRSGMGFQALLVLGLVADAAAIALAVSVLRRASAPPPTPSPGVPVRRRPR